MIIELRHELIDGALIITLQFEETLCDATTRSAGTGKVLDMNSRMFITYIRNWTSDVPYPDKDFPHNPLTNKSLFDSFGVRDRFGLDAIV
jgi:hypothetical protein